MKEIWYVFDRTGMDASSLIVEMRVGRPLERVYAETRPRLSNRLRGEASPPWEPRGTEVAAVEFRTHDDLRAAFAGPCVRRRRFERSGGGFPPAA